MKKTLKIAIGAGTLCILGTIIVLAANEGAIVLNQSNYKIAKETSVILAETISESDNAIMITKEKPVSNILEPDEIEQLFANTITNIETTDENPSVIPSLLMNNGDMVIFVKTDDAGWCLDSGDTLTVKYSLNLDINPGSDSTGESIAFGFIKDGKIVNKTTEKQKSFCFSIIADTKGYYYPFIMNVSAGRIIVDTDGTIFLK